MREDRPAGRNEKRTGGLRRKSRIKNPALFLMMLAVIVWGSGAAVAAIQKNAASLEAQADIESTDPGKKTASVTNTGNDGNQTGSDADQPGNGADQTGNGTDQTDNGTDQSGSGADQTGNGTDQSGNGDDQTGNGTDQSGNGTDQTGNGIDQPGDRKDGNSTAESGTSDGGDASNGSRTIDPDKPMVALTFDDGPAPSTAGILDELEKAGGVCTFFIVGNRVDSYKDDVKRAAEMGCELANHTWEHANLSVLSADDIRRQVDLVNDKIEEVAGVRPTLLRSPGGRITDTITSTVNMPLIAWSIDTEDWKTKNAQSTIDSVMGKVYDGAIILMHDLQESTGEASKTIIPKLVEAGYQLVTVSELAQARGAQLQNGTVYYDFTPQNVG